MLDERLTVHPTNLGIANVVLWWAEGESESSEKGNRVSIACEGCRFDPHVLLCRSGDTLEMLNRDVLGHVVHANFFRNEYFSVSLARSGRQEVMLRDAEPVPVSIGCHTFPWMKSYVMVVGHRSAGVSDPHGIVEIPDLPTGCPIRLRIWHESAKIDEVRINGETVRVRAGGFQIKRKPSLSESVLWELVIPETAFQGEDVPQSLVLNQVNTD